MMDDRSVVYREIVLSRTQKHKKAPLIIGLHGHGSNENQMETLVGLDIAQPHNYLAIRGFHKLDEGGYTWFSISVTQNGITFDVEDVLLSLKRLRNAISMLCDQFNADPEQVYLVGYSQGAVMSLAYTLRYANTLTASAAMAGHLLPELKPLTPNTEALKDFPIFIGHGTLDAVISQADIEVTADYLTHLGLDVTLNCYKIPHVVSVAERRDLSVWLLQQMNRGKKVSHEPA